MKTQESDLKRGAPGDLRVVLSAVQRNGHVATAYSRLTVNSQATSESLRQATAFRCGAESNRNAVRIWQRADGAQQRSPPKNFLAK
jgi:hypothetical protein